MSNTYSLMHLQDGNTALHMACKLGLEEIASLLIAHGASLYARNASGRTARSLALRGGFEDIVAMIDQVYARGTMV